MDLTELVAMSFVLSGYLLIFYLNLFEYLFPLVRDLLFKIIFCEEVAEFFENITNIGSISLVISFLLIIIIPPFLFLPVIDDIPDLCVFLGCLRHVDCVKTISRRKSLLTDPSQQSVNLTV